MHKFNTVRYGAAAKILAQVGRIVPVKSSGTEDTAQQTGKTVLKPGGKLLAGLFYFPLRDPGLSPDYAQKHERTFHQSALGPVAPGPVHACGRVQNLVGKLHTELFPQKQKAGSGAIYFPVPVAGMYPLAHKILYIQIRTPSIFPEEPEPPGTQIVGLSGAAPPFMPEEPLCRR
jgi:hypothetical protein